MAKRLLTRPIAQNIYNKIDAFIEKLDTDTGIVDANKKVDLFLDQTEANYLKSNGRDHTYYTYFRDACFEKELPVGSAINLFNNWVKNQVSVSNDQDLEQQIPQTLNADTENRLNTGGKEQVSISNDQDLEQQISQDLNVDTENRLSTTIENIAKNIQKDYAQNPGTFELEKMLLPELQKLSVNDQDYLKEYQDQFLSILNDELTYQNIPEGLKQEVNQTFNHWITPPDPNLESSVDLTAGETNQADKTGRFEQSDIQQPPQEASPKTAPKATLDNLLRGRLTSLKEIQSVVVNVWRAIEGLDKNKKDATPTTQNIYRDLQDKLRRSINLKYESTPFTKNNHRELIEHARDSVSPPLALKNLKSFIQSNIDNVSKLSLPMKTIALQLDLPPSVTLPIKKELSEKNITFSLSNKEFIQAIKDPDLLKEQKKEWFQQKIKELTVVVNGLGLEKNLSDPEKYLNKLVDAAFRVGEGNASKLDDVFNRIEKISQTIDKTSVADLKNPSILAGFKTEFKNIHQQGMLIRQESKQELEMTAIPAPGATIENIQDQAINMSR